ncbi:hypothetical protein EJ06DRAFT_1086 [Trichodelitschia bisporula]|uniref:Uncharacterized protein n=1 Tax=Trichodelitschia bisporula TaxID=703511 RepID=A0A6G1I9W3_9PEZI|nr:hypothetical protein EJ06DRAFT_1086 [Trichodelitschia bisporula]
MAADDTQTESTTAWNFNDWPAGNSADWANAAGNPDDWLWMPVNIDYRATSDVGDWDSGQDAEGETDGECKASRETDEGKVVTAAAGNFYGEDATFHARGEPDDANVGSTAAGNIHGKDAGLYAEGGPDNGKVESTVSGINHDEDFELFVRGQTDHIFNTPGKINDEKMGSTATVDMSDKDFWRFIYGLNNCA